MCAADFFEDRRITNIDDLMTTVGLVIDMGTELGPADYRLTPVNAQGRPWTAIEILPPVKPPGRRSR